MLILNIKLKEVLKKNGMTQMQLSEKSGVNQARISQLCSPKTKRKEVNLEMLEKIALALNIKDISELMQFEEVN